MNRLAYISHPDTLLHIMDGQHPESPARITAINNALNASPIKQQLTFYTAPLATPAQLKRVHDAQYVDTIYRIAPKAGLVRLDADTAMGPASLEATLRASGAAILATDLVMQQQALRAFCCIRPPGHHAGKGNSAGFCIFNHVAVGVAHAMAEYGVKKVAIIDFDVHHGDGTEDIFKDNPNVMLCSTFQHPFYPYKGADTSNAHIRNFPLAAESNGEVFKQVFMQQIGPAVAQFKPDLLFISAGFDAHEADPLANLQLTTFDYRWMTEFITDLAVKFCKGRLISCLEGGYDLRYLPQCTMAHILALTH